MTKRPRSTELVPIHLDSATLTPLDPAQLDPLAEDAARDLLAEGESENTVRSYQAALRYWAAWFHLRYGRPMSLPVPPTVVIQYIVDHAERKVAGKLKSELPAVADQALVAGGFKARLGPPALATLLHRVTVLSKVHRLKTVKNPCQDSTVRELLEKTRAAYAKRGVKQAKKPALTKDPLTALLATCDDSLRGVRDRALLLFAWSSGGRRRSEVTSATMDNLTKVAERAYIYALLHSKTNQTGADLKDGGKPIAGQAADALSLWLQRSGIVSGAIFRRVLRSGQIGEPLSPSAVRDIVKARAARAGLGDAWSAHSLRSGFVTEAARQGVPMGETMGFTGHTSVSTLIGYFRTEASLNSRGAQLFEDQ